VRRHLVPKSVRAEMLIARMEYDLLSSWVNTKVAIASADGAVAAVDCMSCEGWDVDGVSHIATVAVCVVRGEVRRQGLGRVRGAVDFWLLIIRLELLPIDIIQLQLFHIDVPNQTDVNGHFILFAVIDEHATTTSGAKFMNLLVVKAVRDHMLISGVDIDIRSFRVDEQVAISSADGTIAAVDLVIREGRCPYSERYGAAVAVAMVGGVLLGRGHGCR